jgi:hypothetical protein
MRIQLGVALVLAGFAGGAHAADWLIEPRVDLNYESNDNNRMSAVPGDEISVSGAELDARLTMTARMPRSSFRVVPRIRATKYPDEPDDETTNGYLQMRWDYGGIKSLTRVKLDYAHRTVLGRYFPEGASDDGGLGNPDPGTGTGDTTFPTDQDDFKFRPEFSIDLTERTAFIARLGYQNVDFEEQELNDRVSFTDTGGALGLQFRTSPTARLSVTAGASLYEPDTDFDTDAQTVNVTWANQISEVSKYYVSGGASRVKTDNALNSDWQSGFNGGAGVQWQFEVTELFLEFNHYVDPSSSGRMINRDQLRFEWNRKFSDRTGLEIAARAVRDGDVGDLDILVTKEYFAGSVAYEWRFLQSTSMQVGYEYSWRKYEDDPNDAASNRVFLGVSYQPRRK